MTFQMTLSWQPVCLALFSVATACSAGPNELAPTDDEEVASVEQTIQSPIFGSMTGNASTSPVAKWYSGIQLRSGWWIDAINYYYIPPNRDYTLYTGFYGGNGGTDGYINDCNNYLPAGTSAKSKLVGIMGYTKDHIYNLGLICTDTVGGEFVTPTYGAVTPPSGGTYFWHHCEGSEFVRYFTQWTDSYVNGIRVYCGTYR
jgi:hypothetical protein